MMSDPTYWSLSARWIIPVEGPPLPDGVVRIEGTRIAAIEPASSQPADIELGDAIVLPGLVNAHTHLDLSGFAQPVPYDGDFTNWLRSVIVHRRQAAPAAEQIKAGLAESLAYGVTLLGDISARGQSWPLLANTPVRAVVFYEALGLPRDRAEASCFALLDWLYSCAPANNLRAGLSPHAPYSTRRELYQVLASVAVDQRLVLSTHLAETQVEQELLQSHQGPFVSFLQELNVWDESGLVHDAADVLDICRDIPQLLLAHGTHLDPAQLRGWPGTMVYCPRTHAHFREQPHPFRQLLAQGTRVALGTDSRASNPDLDLLAEARFLHQQYPEVDCAALLRMATLSGAEALGWQAQTGSLSVGKSADLIVVPIEGSGDDPHRLVLGSTTAVQRVLYQGCWRG